MSKLIRIDSDYKIWIMELKQRIRQAQIKAAVKVNVEMLHLYWSIGEDIVKRKAEAVWGEGVVEQLAQDLRDEFPNMKGFSRRNLFYMKQWYLFYSQEDIKMPQVVAQIGNVDDVGKMPQVVAQLETFFSIPWGHHRYILDKIKDVKEALFYVHKTIENGWSRNVLLNMLDTRLYEVQGKAITNFNRLLPALQSDLAQQTLKDPYDFDFLTMREGYMEKELEDALTENITKFLLELGRGFAYVGRQFRLEVGKEEFFADLLFYNYRLRSFVVVELKTGKFKAEYVSKLGLYVSAVNHQLRHRDDSPTIGLLICKSKDEIVAKYTLDMVNEPIGVSEYELTNLIPDDFKSSLPSIEDIENELKKTE
ncbi:MAG: PDDEXK nuclease domain-containing protein [Odoribacter sp.]